MGPFISELECGAPDMTPAAAPASAPADLLFQLHG